MKLTSTHSDRDSSHPRHNVHGWIARRMRVHLNEKKDEQIILTYIDDFDLDAEATGSGLYVVIDEAGSGVNPTIYDEVSVFYRGALTSGEVFDLTGTEPAVFPLSQVIEGWQEGIPYFKPGGSGTLLIPSHLGYGSQSAGSIPPNSVLVFDITLVRVN